MLSKGPEGHPAPQASLVEQLMVPRRGEGCPKRLQQASGSRPSRHPMPASVLGGGGFSVLEPAGAAAKAASDTVAIIGADSNDDVTASIRTRFITASRIQADHGLSGARR